MEDDIGCTIDTPWCEGQCGLAWCPIWPAPTHEDLLLEPDPEVEAAHWKRSFDRAGFRYHTDIEWVKRFTEIEWGLWTPGGGRDQDKPGGKDGKSKKGKQG